MSTIPAVVMTVLVLGGGTSPLAQPSLAASCYVSGQIIEEVIASQNFQRSVGEYVALHRSIDRQVPPPVTTDDVSQINRAVRLLQMRIQASRAAARQGDIITAEVARMFRRRIASCLLPDEWNAFFAEREQDEEGEAVEAPPLHVNMAWPAGVPFDFVPPQLLQALPALPEELQYRIIGRSLVICDHHANLIVDFLPDAFVPAT